MTAKKKKILMIEDEPTLSEMYKLYLNKVGCEVLFASDGQAGLEIAKQKKPDLILLDILMPHMDGWEVIKNLKCTPETNQIPVIVFSNLGQLEEIEKGLNLGADDYIVKTELTPKELAERVVDILGYLDKTGEKDSKKRILIIENERDNANLYKTKLEKEDFEVEIAKNGNWGLRLAKIGNFNLIFMNIFAPGLVGEEAVKDLKQDPRTKNTPLIIFSRADSMAEQEIKKIIDLGAADYFIATKVSPNEIIGEIKELIKKHD